MANREFLMLAHDADLEATSIGGWIFSEKLDGMRALWDGGVTRGMKASDVPFANVEKHGRFKEEVIATGLWSRYGQVVRAPDWWLNKLPLCMSLDGELWAGRGNYQFLMSTVKKHEANDDSWQRVQYRIFDAPNHSVWLQDGKINNTNYKKIFQGFWKLHPMGTTHDLPALLEFQYVYKRLKEKTDLENDIVRVHDQNQLPWGQDEAVKQVEYWCNTISEADGEGLILRKHTSVWTPHRSHYILKVKKLLDSEAEVIGYTTGRKTDKGSKLLGKMGALIVKWEGKTFELSGFTDEERGLGCTDYNDFNAEEAERWAIENPEKELPPQYCAMRFPRGTKVTFKYRELTDAGIPKEARYWRKYAT
jgi:ATP-dependent DNA ligase